jgi:hypothetical protein
MLILKLQLMKSMLGIIFTTLVHYTVSSTFFNEATIGCLNECRSDRRLVGGMSGGVGGDH